MSDLQTVKVKHGDGDYALINRSDYDPKTHQPFDDEAKVAVGEEAAHADEIARRDALRMAESNRGVTAGVPFDSSGRNTSGTYSEPTPTDVRYPDKDATEFENNHGAHVSRAAPAMREEMGLPDAPGGIKPDEPAEPTFEGRRVAKGPGGRFYVMNGDERLSKGFATEAEANAEMAGPANDASAEG